MAIAYFDGAFIEDSAARVSVFTHALHYGTAVFEGIRSYGDGRTANLFRAHDHYERFLGNARLLDMDDKWSAAELTEITIELLRRNGFFDDRYIRPLLYKNTEEFGAGLPKGETLAILATVMPHGRGPRRPIRATWSKWRRFSGASCPAGAKISGLYVNSSLARADALARGYDQPILLTTEGFVSEGYGANIFAVFGNDVVTTPLDADILPGITRATLIDYFQSDKEIQMSVEHLAPERLLTADEAFFCGTGMEIVPIGEIEGKKLGEGHSAGPITSEATAWYQKVVRGQESVAAKWLTKVV